MEVRMANIKAPNSMKMIADAFDLFDVAKTAKQRAKLSRILGKKALKSFHPRLFNDRLFAGDTWSDKNGCHTRNQTSALC
jgi:hypothetical protein